MPLRTIPFTPEEREAAFWAKVHKQSKDGCWVWTASKNVDGYGNFFHEGKGCSAHRFSYTLAHGQIPLGAQVLHNCDNPPCVNPAHLRVGTVRDNMADRKARGRQADRRGSKNPKAKLTEDDIGTIVELSRKGIRQAEIGDRFNIDQTTVSRVVRGASWKHVPADDAYWLEDDEQLRYETEMGS